MQEEEKQNGSSGTPSEQPKKHKKEKGKSLIETMREIDAKEAQKEAEAEERRQEILAEREKKEKEAYAKKIQQDRIELMRLKQGIITESDTIYEEKEEKPKLLEKDLQLFISQQVVAGDHCLYCRYFRVPHCGFCHQRAPGYDRAAAHR